jgi:hypothetical protein
VQNDSWSWLLWTLKRKGLYYSNGVTWEYIDSPLAATVAEWQDWILNDVYISPYVLQQLFGNVDNTSDLNKPISIDTQIALNDKVDESTTITINWVTQDLSTNRTWTISWWAWDTFETTSQNLKAYPFVLNYTMWVLTSIVYTVPAWTITKTLNYTGDKLTSVVLSGSTPSWIDLTKTLSYTGDSLTGVTYS